MLFPQMKSEVKAARGKDEAFLEKGIPAAYMPRRRKAGYDLVSTLQGASPAKIQQQLIEILKKYKEYLGGLEKPSQEDITKWTE